MTLCSISCYRSSFLSFTTFDDISTICNAGESPLKRSLRHAESRDSRSSAKHGNDNAFSSTGGSVQSGADLMADTGDEGGGGGGRGRRDRERGVRGDVSVTEIARHRGRDGERDREREREQYWAEEGAFYGDREDRTEEGDREGEGGGGYRGEGDRMDKSSMEAMVQRAVDGALDEARKQW